MNRSMTPHPAHYAVLIIGAPDTFAEIIAGWFHSTIVKDADCHYVAADDVVRIALTSSHWDLILCDFDLQSLNMPEAIRTAQRLLPKTPLIVVANTAAVKDVVDMMRLGARGFVEKADIQRLIELVTAEIESAEASPSLNESVTPLDLCEQIDAILGTTQDALMSFSLPDRKLIYVSTAFESVFGYPVQRFLDEPDYFKQIVPPEELQSVLGAMDSCLRDGLVEIEHRVIFPDGRTRWLHRRAWVTYDAVGQSIQVNDSARDITDAKQAEAALHHTEERLRSIVGNLQDVVWSADYPSFQITYLNPAARTIYGRSEREFLEDPTTWMNIMHPDDAPRIQAMTDALAGDGFRDVEYRILRPDGEVRWLRDRAWLVKDEQGRAYHAEGIAIDITAQKLAADSLRASEAKQNALFAAIPDIMFHLRADGTILEYHGPSIDLILPLDMIIGKNIAAFFDSPFVPKSVLSQAIAAVQSVITNRQLIVFEYVMPDQRDYETRFIPVGDTDEIMCIIRDITERKRAERELRESEQRLRLFIEYAPAAIAILDKEMRYVAVSRRWLQDYRLADDDIVGRSHYDVFPEITDRLKEIHRRCLKGAIEKGDAEPFLRLDGAMDWVRWEIRPWRESNGDIGGILLFSEVITERVKADEALRQSESYLRSLIDSQTAFNVRVDMTGDISYCNGRYQDQFSWLAPSLIGRSSMETVLPEDHPKVQQAVMECLLHVGTPVQVEVRKIAPNGGYIWTLWEFIAVQAADGTVSEVQCVGFDITKQKRAELELQEAYDLLEQRVIERTSELERAKDRIEAIFNHSGDGILLLDIQQGIQQANYAFGQMFGIPVESLSGSRLPIFFHPDDASMIEETISAVAASHQTQQIEACAIRADSTSFNVEISLAPVNRSEKAVNSLVCIIRDITERIQAQEALRSSEERYRLLAENVNDVLIKLGMDGRITFVSASLYHVLGYHPEELIGMIGGEIAHPDDLADGSNTILNALNSGSSYFTLSARLRHKDGHYVWVEITSTVVFDSTTSMPVEMIGVLRDITERKKAEAALRDSEERYRLLAENVNDVLIKLSPEGKITFASSSLYAVLGYHPEELMDNVGFELVHPDDLASGTMIVMNALSTGAMHFTMSARMLHKAGQYVWIEIAATVVLDPITGLPVEMVGVLRDITERKQAENALRSSEEKFRTFVESAPIATIITDMRGKVVLVNGAAAKLFDYDRAELIGDSVVKLVPEEFREEQIKRFVYSSELEDRRTVSFESAGRRKDGSVFAVDTQLSIIETPEGPMVMSHVIDVTKRKEAELALKQSLAQEKELGELKSRFVSMASHEFRTPLAAILAATETLTLYRDRMDAGQIDGRLDRIRQQVTYMKDTIEDVLHLARMQAGRVKFEPFSGDVDVLCREIVSEFDVQAEFGGRIIYDCPTVPVRASFDERLLRQIVGNLIHNALKYSLKEKSVMISVTHDEEQFALRIKDEGIGIPDEDMKHLFEPFHRAKNVGTISGTGLGLSITRQSVELHGGVITVESEVGAGTTFTVNIPKKQPLYTVSR